MRPLADLELDSNICAFFVRLGLINGVLGANRYQFSLIHFASGAYESAQEGFARGLRGSVITHLLRARGQKT